MTQLLTILAAAGGSFIGVFLAATVAMTRVEDKQTPLLKAVYLFANQMIENFPSDAEYWRGRRDAAVAMAFSLHNINLPKKVD